MKSFLKGLILFALAVAALGDDPPAKQLLRYVYGAEGLEVSTFMHPAEDAWMLRGTNNSGALAAVNALTVTHKTNGVVSGLVGMDLHFVETRDGKVDPTFNLEAIYGLHRQLIHRFIYSALSQDMPMLGRLTTDSSKVQILGPKAPPGEMGQYGEIISMMPVVRTSKADGDAKSKTITYRVPVGGETLRLTLVKQGNTWRIDSSQGVRISVGFFFW